tara:strand:- start:47 stop:421 length:375 start_codon:yes stop_codon:yes gene_type:complete
MRKVAILLSLTMMFCSLAGCLGGDDDESVSPVGVWYSAETMAVDIKEDGSLIDGEGNSGTWSTNGGILTMTIDEARTYNYAVEGDWLWIQMVDDDDDCHALSSESIPNDEYDDRVSEQTPPSFC